MLLAAASTATSLLSYLALFFSQGHASGSLAVRAGCGTRPRLPSELPTTRRLNVETLLWGPSAEPLSLLQLAASEVRRSGVLVDRTPEGKATSREAQHEGTGTNRGAVDLVWTSLASVTSPHWLFDESWLAIPQNRSILTFQLATQDIGVDENSSALATVVLCIVFLIIVCCFFYLLSAQYQLHRNARGPPTGEFVSAFRPPAKRQSVDLGTSPSMYAPKSTGILSREDKDLPTIYRQLVMPVHARLAIPLGPLEEAEFDIDILSPSGDELLTASLALRPGGTRNIQINLHSVRTLLAVVTPELQVIDADAKLVGTLVPDGGEQYIFNNDTGRPVLVLVPSADNQEVCMLSISRGGHTDCASVVRQPPGRLPAEHYALVANPGVDAVLILACFLALVVFAHRF